MAQVSLQNVSKFYPGDKKRPGAAVRDFNLEIEDREFVVLVGPSGCGKSTTLRMIAGLEKISQGEISIGGRVVNRLPSKDRDIAMVFQNYALYPHLSVYENMAFGLRLRKTSPAEIDRRVRESAHILGIADYLSRKPKALSGGQRQRVALGRAMVRQPQVFLFDEPLSNLDARLRVQMRAEIIQLHRRVPATMIYVTHDQVEAMTMGDRLVVMDAVENPKTGEKEGVIQQIGKPLTIYHAPVNLFVASFIGSPPMNFLAGSARLVDGRFFFEEDRNGPVRLELEDRLNAQDISDRKLILGVRPEDIAVHFDEGEMPAGTFSAVVDIVEVMGAETNLHLQTGVHPMICRVQNLLKIPQVGDRLKLQINPAKVHLFDPATKLRLVNPQ